ncbi:MAG TPA: hypothetical protein VJX67_14370 [Blastocatellia bacterium]|nr:hypothetical protein [Blastocatellia bacterium]
MRNKGIVLAAVFVAATAVLAAGQGKQAAKPGQQLPIADIIQRFTTAESENKLARDNYVYTQDFDMKTIGMGGFISGEFHRVSEITYDDKGARFEKITFFPASTLEDLSITAEDLRDLAEVQPFALTHEDLPKYQVDYVGKEHVDELNTYVFDMKPKKFVEGERYFEGRIWVDDQDLQIVKAKGQAVPQIADQAFPHFESYRENVDGKYWFPTYVYADDVLEFKKSASVHMRMVIRYTNYRKFTTTIRVVPDAPATSEQPDTKPAAPVKPPPGAPYPKL